MEYFRRNLLWFDSFAGLTVGMVMLLTCSWLTVWYGLPFKVVLFVSIANLTYGVYSFYLASRSIRPAKFITLLVVANLSWSIVCITLSIAYWDTATFLGNGHLALEGIFVGGLGCVEWIWRKDLEERT